MSRVVPEKPIFTFSNGAIAQLERVGPLFAMPILKAYPPPDPPLAPGVGGEMQPNRADPDFEVALQEHDTKVQLIMNDLLLDLGISDTMEIDQVAVDRYRSIMRKAGIELPEDDRMLYIKYCCLTQEEDFAVYQAIRDYDAPSEEAIAAAANMFQRHGTRTADLGSNEVAAQEPDTLQRAGA
jgi:hypothetical protein